MGIAVVMSRALDGLDAPPVRVEVQLAAGLPSFTLVGLADTEVKEARERVRASLQQCALPFPANRRVTVNLAPADLPKESGRFDLPIALGLLAAAGELCPAMLAAHEFAGELSLAGELRPVRGALALALAARRDGAPRALVLPAASAAVAAHVPGLVVHEAEHLAQVVRAMRPEGAGERVPLPRAAPAPRPAAPEPPDLRDVKGQPAARRALEIAAAGGHSLLFFGPPGAGKTMLAERLPGLLPPLAEAEALANAALHGLAPGGPRAREAEAAALGARPFRAPHHTASAAALVGGGSPPRPGEISLAHGGVLFLDELPEFPRAALEALREPLEAGCITLSRAARQATFPARFQLVAAMNPCPCGRLGTPASPAAPGCRCTPDAIHRYRRRLSGPLLDRIDLHVDVRPVEARVLTAALEGEASAAVAGRVAAARAVQQQRQGRLNARLAGAALDRHAAPDAAGLQFLHGAAERLGWSGRRLHRVMRVARTIADLAGSARPALHALAEAVQLQRGFDTLDQV